MFHSNTNQKKAGTATLKDKIDFVLNNNNNNNIRNKRYIIIKGSIHQEDVTIINVHELKN